MALHLEFEQWVPCPVERVFLFFADPRNLPRIMPAGLQTRIIDLRLVPPPQALENSSLAGIGSEIVTSFRVVPPLPFHLQWVAQITEFEWNHHFADIQKKGPLKFFHHRHEFVEEARAGVRGTRVRDVIDLDAGFGILGDLAEPLFVRLNLHRTFGHRQQVLQELLAQM